MEVRDGIMVVTGGASGIGRALAQAFHAEGARHVVVADRDEAGAKAVAEEISGTGIGLDVASEEEIKHLVESTQQQHRTHRSLHVKCRLCDLGWPRSPNEEINRMWQVHVMSAHLCGACGAPFDDCAWSWLHHEHSICGRIANPSRLASLFLNQACCRFSR